MKAAESKTTTTAQPLQPKAETQEPFFQKERTGSVLEQGNPPFFSSQSLPQPFFNKPTIQTKLTIGQPGDKYEQEADQMADQVVQRLAEPNPSGSVPLGGNGRAGKTIQRKPIFESNAEPAIQAKFQTSSAPTIPLIQAKCADCEKEEQLQRKEEGNEEDLQRKPIFESDTEPPNDVQMKRTECENKEQENIQAKSKNSIIQLQRAESPNREVMPSSGFCLYNPFRSGTISFTGLSVSQLSEFGIMPEESQKGCVATTPVNDHIYDADGVWWQRRPGQWLKVPGNCYLEISVVEGTIQFSGCCNGVMTIIVPILKGYPGQVHWTNDGHNCRPVWEATAVQLQRKARTDSSVVQLKCTDCAAEEETSDIQRADVSMDTPSTSHSLENLLSSSQGGGSPLPDATRSQMEGAFRTDFSTVRVHTDSSAVQMNKELGAQAFTHGSDVYFNAGKYDTGSTEGQHLLAHELVHTIQQSSGNQIQRWHPPDTPALENELSPDGFLIEGRYIRVERLWYEQYYSNHQVEANRLIIQRLSESSMPWIAELPEAEIERAANNIRLTIASFEQGDIQTAPIVNSIYIWLGLPPGTNMIWDFPASPPPSSSEADESGTPSEPTAPGGQVTGSTSVFRLARLMINTIELENVSGNPSISTPLLTEILDQLETQVGAPIVPDIRAQIIVNGHLGDPLERQQASVYLIVREAMILFFGERAWLEFEQRMSGSGGVASGQEPGNVQIETGIPNEEQHFARRMLEEIFGQPPEDSDHPTTINIALIAILHEIDNHPDRTRIVENLQQAASQTSGSGGNLVSSLRRAMQAVDMQVEYERLHITPGSGAVENRAFPWQVEGRIVNHTDLLFTGKDAAFSVKILSRELPRMLLMVPWVRVHWVVRETAERETSATIMETGYTSHRDRLERPERFTLSFDRVGIYEINALVNHDLFVPNHFSIFVEVRTGEERFAEVQDRAYSPSLWGEVDSDTRETNHEFEGTSGTDFWDTGTVYEGEMPLQSRMGMPPIPGHLDALEARISELEAYLESGRFDDDGREWATEYLAAMEEVRTNIRSELDGGAQLVFMEAAYLSRGERATSQALQIVANARHDEEGWHFTINDTTQAFDSRNSRFEETDPTYRGALERAFTELCKSYPRGLMSARIEILNQTTGETTGRYVGFELECNSTREAVRSVAYHPVVSGVINIAGTVVALFIPATAPFIIPTLIAYNAIDTVGNMVDLGARDALTTEDVAIGTAQLAIDLIPYVGRATRLVRIGTTTFRVMEGLEIAGEVVLMTAQAQEQVQSIRMGVVSQAAEVHARIRDLEANNPSDPELPRLREQFGELQTQANQAWLEVGGQMVQDQLIMRASMRVVHSIHHQHLARVEQSRQSITEALSSRSRAPVRTEDYGHISRVMGVRVETLTPGENIGSGDVRIAYDVGLLGGITNVRLQVGPEASLSMVMHHERTLGAMRRYEGVTGSLHSLLDRVQAWVRGGGHIPPYTRAFEARFELQKLPPIIQSLRQELTSGVLTEDTRTRIEAQITYLEQQLEMHAGAFNDLAEGLGYVAARDTTTQGPVPDEGGDAGATMGRRRSDSPDPSEQSRARPFVSVDEPPMRYRRESVTYETFRDTVGNIAPLSEGVVYEFPGGHRVWRIGDTIMHDSTIGPSSGQRMGFEHQLWSAAESGRPKLEGMHRVHTLGQGTGFESPFGILYAPAEVNLIIQNNGIEEYFRGIQAAVPRGESVHVLTRTRAYPGTQQLREIRYRVEVYRGGGRREWLFDYVIEVGNDVPNPTVTHGIGNVTHQGDLQRYFSAEEVDVPARLRNRFGSRAQRVTVADNFTEILPFIGTRIDDIRDPQDLPRLPAPYEIRRYGDGWRIERRLDCAGRCTDDRFYEPLTVRDGRIEFAYGHPT